MPNSSVITMDRLTSVFLKATFGIFISALPGLIVGIISHITSCDGTWINMGLRINTLLFGVLGLIQGALVGLCIGLTQVRRMNAAGIGIAISFFIPGIFLPSRVYCHSLYGMQFLWAIVTGALIGWFVGEFAKMGSK